MIGHLRFPQKIKKMLTALRASTKNAASTPSLSEDNPEQITKLPERLLRFSLLTCQRADASLPWPPKPFAKAATT
jgi:hypothetical protein